ncbi:MAG: UPF0182 family protein [Armatimonadota bacterium]|nr:UPF0182 family protein [Armatimonadota bacterium]
MRRAQVIGWALVILLFVVGPTLARWYTDWLWFGELGYERVFWVPFLSRVAVTIVVGGALWLLLYANVRPVLRAARAETIDMMNRGGTYRRVRPRWGVPLGWWGWLLVGVAFVTGLSTSRHWAMLQQFLHATPFGAADPLFGRDVGFYVFKLPVYRLVADGLFVWLVLITVGAVLGYGAIHGRLMLRGLWLAPAGVRTHLSLLIGAAVLVRGAGFWLDAFELLYSSRGPVFGAAFADVHAVLPALRILTFLFGVCGLLLIANVWLRTVRLAIATLILIAVAWTGGLVLYPGLVQTLRVRPNELTAETPFIVRAIAATRAGYGLDRVREHEFPTAPLERQAIERNRATIENVRLWDYRPMLRALNQLQTLRPYYTFSDVDIDRYPIGGVQRQVMLAARELAINRLPVQARTWVNEHLVYTHGYGLVMTPINRVSDEGMPEFYIHNFPPESSAGIAVTRPEIYYGELTNNYVIVNTNVRELDYPRGEENVYTRYAGRGGIRLGYLARLALAYRYADAKLLLSRDIRRDSRMLMIRQVTTRASRIAPFLRYDRDPYLVVADGRLFWIIDAYTVTDRYPYATRYGDLNYMRNSVKVVVDAYDGTVTFYLMTPDEPIARTLASIFPTLFRPGTQMPASLAAHLRYPVDLFEVQAQVFSTFHMRDPQVFYNREDTWTVPREIFGNETVRVEPYYVTMRVAEGTAPEFILMLPLVPSGRDNMIAWMAARNDPPRYGELIVYRFPKTRIVFGPMQIESRIDQDPIISSQLTLWNQQGSQVIRGNLLVIPIEEGLLYVEPLFLQSERSQIPELRRVIAVTGARIIMAPTLDAALAELFGPSRPQTPPGTGPGTAPGATLGPDAAALAEQALAVYRRAQERLRSGDLAGYGQDMERLGQILERLRTVTQR